jgi:hypothetical protein
MDAASKSVDFHFINNNQLTLDAINHKAEDYFFNMDFIMRNIKKMQKILERYELIFKDAVTIKKIFLKMYKQFESKFSRKEKISGLFNKIGKNSHNVNFKEMYENIDIFNGYYGTLRRNNIHLTDDRIYGKILI